MKAELLVVFGVQHTNGWQIIPIQRQQEWLILIHLLLQQENTGFHRLIIMELIICIMRSRITTEM